MLDFITSRLASNHRKSKAILNAWLQYIQVDALANATVDGKIVYDQELELKGNRLWLSPSLVNQIQKDSKKSTEPSDFTLSLAFPQIYKISNNERKFFPLFTLDVSFVLKEAYTPEGWDLKECDFTPVPPNLTSLFDFEDEDIKNLVTKEGIHTFCRETFGVAFKTLDEFMQKLKLPSEYKVDRQPYLCNFAYSSFTANLQQDLQLILDNDKTWARREHPAYEFLFGEHQPDIPKIAYLGAFPSKHPPTLSQAKVLRHAQANPVTAVQGPPGSGKTTLILHIIAQQVVKRALRSISNKPDINNLTVITSTNNRAVKNVAEKLAEEISSELFYLEGGNKSNIKNNVIPRLQKAIDWLKSDSYNPREQRERQNQLKSIVQTLRNKGFSDKFYEENHEAYGQLFNLAREYLHQEALRRKDEVLTALETYRSTLEGNWNAKQSLEKDYKLFLTHISLLFPVLTCTLLSIRNMLPFPEESCVDRIIVDEAGMIPQHQLFPILVRGRRAIIVGDPLQIEPVVSHSDDTLERYKQEAFIKQGLSELDYCRYSPAAIDTATAYHRAASASGELGDIGKGICLREHYRCQKAIAQYCNAICDYNFEVKTKEKPSLLDYHLMAYHVEGRMNNKVNVAEIEVVEKIIEYLLAKGYQIKTKEGQGNIGVISPFRAQADALRKQLESRWGEFKGEEAIGTVHTFQGGEKSVMILSTRVYRQEDSGSVGFINCKPNLLNVAVSRAKELLIVVGNLDYLLQAGSYTGELIKHIERYGQIRQAVEVFPTSIPNAHKPVLKKTEVTRKSPQPPIKKAERGKP